MQRRLILPIALLAALLSAAPAAAKATYRVGMSEQHAEMFNQSAFQSLGLKKVRFLVAWDFYKDDWQVDAADHYLNTALANGYEPFVTFTAHRGCWQPPRYSKRKACRAPSVKRYARAVRTFRARYPQVRVFGTWNEMNHASQPIARRPKRAAKYYNALRRNCRGCTIVAADVLEAKNLERYLRAFRRAAKGSPRLWGYHNYSSVNRARTSGTTRMLRAVPGSVWLTETGGIVKFQGFKYSESRAAKRTRFLFRLADRYDRRRAGMRSRITRLYYYSWTGAPRGSRWDSGLTDLDGSPRKHLSVFRSLVEDVRK